MAVLSACVMPQPGMQSSLFGAKFQPAVQQQRQQEYFVDETVEVLTEPPGAKILINDAAVGYSPVTAPVRRQWRGSPGRMILDTVKVEAYPTGAGQCVQSGIFGQNSGKTPPQVSFDMAACSAAPPAPAPASAPARQRSK